MKKKLLVLITALYTFAITNQTKAQTGAALNLDGNATYVDFGTNPALGLQTANFSIEAWVNPAGGSGGQLILFNGACNVLNGGWGLSYNGGDFTNLAATPNSGKLSFYVLSSVDNNYYQLDQQSNLPIGQWTHVAVTNDGTALKMYINGVLDNTLTGYYVPVNTNSSFKIGADPNVACNNIPRYVYNGSIDELRLFNYALNQCQVNATMNCELAQSRIGLIFYTKFNEGTANGTNTITTVADSSGNAFDGTMSNFALTGTTSNWVAPGAVTSGNACSLATGHVSIKLTSPVVSPGDTTTLLGMGASSYTWTNTGATTTSISISPTVTTTYTLMGNDGAGTCTGIGVLTITVAPRAATLNFDGVDDYVSVSDNAALDFGTNDFTIEADFQSSTSQPDYAGVVVKANSSSNGGYQLVLVGNKIAAEFSNTSGNFLGVANGLQGTSILNDGNWHHLAMVVNRANNNIKLLVDGNVEADVTDPSISTTDVTYPAADMLIGVERTSALYTNANLDEVRVWSRALCALEIQNNLHGELSAASRTGLVAYYKFNQGFSNSNNPTVSILADSSGNSFNGLLNNFALTGTHSNFTAPGAVTTGSMVTAFSNTLSAVATQTNVACNGDANGTASVAATGILSPFTYTWSSGGSSNIENNLVAGNYTCTIANACGSIKKTFTITEPAQLIASSTSGTIACNGGATTVTVSATGGTTTYSNTGTFTVTANSYTYTVTDANSCTATTTITVSEPAQALIVSSTSGTIACNGGTTTVTVSATGGVPSYSNTGTFTVTANSYTYTVTDANSCAVTTTITISEPTAISPNFTIHNVTCFGANDGWLSVAPTGGTPAYMVTWPSIGNGTFEGGLTAGTYTCVITDNNNCIATSTVAVTQPNVLTVNQILINNVSCNGGNDATANVTVIGGTAPYSYAWLPNTTQTTYTVTNLSAQSYTCNITDANLCTTGTTFTVTQPNPIDTSVTSTLNPYPAITANQAGATYQWFYCNGSTYTPITGATQQTYTVPGGVDYYAVIITVGVCSDTSNCIYMDLEGIAKYNSTNKLQVYPNPFSNELTITSTAKTNAVVFDMLGNKINEYVLHNTTQTISLGDLAPGMYYLQVDAQKIKIIKQ